VQENSNLNIEQSFQKVGQKSKIREALANHGYQSKIFPFTLDICPHLEC